MIVRGLATLRSGPPIETSLESLLAIVSGNLLFAGLWTPVAGSIVFALGLWNEAFEPGDPWTNILLAAIGSALALVGRGAWSIDARRFGWKRIDVRNRKT